MALLVACTGEPPPPPLDPVEKHAAERIVRLAGDAAATPLLVRLAAVFQIRHPGPRVLVDTPLRGADASRAVADGALAGALRLLREEQRPKRAVRIARTTPVLVASSGVPIRRLSTEALAATLRGESSTWPDGMARRMLLHPEGDPLQGALLGTHPLLREALREALDTDEHRQVAYHTAFHESVAGTPGTLAVSDTGSLRLRGAPLWRVRIEGHTAPALTLWLEMAPKRSPRLQAFVDFAAGAQGRTLVAELGYEVPR